MLPGKGGMDPLDVQCHGDGGSGELLETNTRLTKCDKSERV